MRNYRAYILGIDGHRFVWAKDYVADHPDDAAAVEAAKRLSDKHAVEVWEAGRLVAQWSPAADGNLPELAPPLAFVPPPDGEKNSAAEPVSLSCLSEVMLATSSEKAQALPRK
jgi:hypothetical protein